MCVIRWTTSVCRKKSSCQTEHVGHRVTNGDRPIIITPKFLQSLTPLCLLFSDTQQKALCIYVQVQIHIRRVIKLPISTLIPDVIREALLYLEGPFFLFCTEHINGERGGQEFFFSSKNRTDLLWGVTFSYSMDTEVLFHRYSSGLGVILTRNLEYLESRLRIYNFVTKTDKDKAHPCTGTEALYRPYGP